MCYVRSSVRDIPYLTSLVTFCLIVGRSLRWVDLVSKTVGSTYRPTEVFGSILFPKPLVLLIDLVMHLDRIGERVVFSDCTYWVRLGDSTCLNVSTRRGDAVLSCSLCLPLLVGGPRNSVGSQLPTCTAGQCIAGLFYGQSNGCS